MAERLPTPDNLKEFNRLFPDEEACVEYLTKLRWPDGFVCPKCGAGLGSIILTRALVQCRNKHQISVTSGTGLHRTKQPLWDWFFASYLISTLPPGVSALQLQRQLGTKSYETAFMLLHKIRSALVDPERKPLKGEVEVNEAFIGGPEEGRPGRGAKDKALIVIGVEVVRWQEARPNRESKWTRHDNSPMVERVRAGRVRLNVIRNSTSSTLTPWIQKNVDPGSLVVTDGLSSYASLKKLGYGHKVMIPKKDNPASFLPLSHLVVSNLKAWLQGTYHGAVDKKHLQAYLNEYVFRFNRRMWRGSAFIRCLRMLLHTDSVEYDELYDSTNENPGMLP